MIISGINTAENEAEARHFIQRKRINLRAGHSGSHRSLRRFFIPGEVTFFYLSYFFLQENFKLHTENFKCLSILVLVKQPFRKITQRIHQAGAFRHSDYGYHLRHRPDFISKNSRNTHAISVVFPPEAKSAHAHATSTMFLLEWGFNFSHNFSGFTIK